MFFKALQERGNSHEGFKEIKGGENIDNFAKILANFGSLFCLFQVKI